MIGGVFSDVFLVHQMDCELTASVYIPRFA